jgi:hypothetical protein
VITLRDPAPVRLLTPGRNTALGRRLLLLAPWRPFPRHRRARAWPCFGSDPPVWAPRQGSHQDGGYSQKVNTIRLAIRTFGA